MTQSLVLIVDDEPAIRRLLRTSLQAQGYRTLEADTGARAVAQIAGEKPDLVLLDLGLPDMDGLEVIRLVRAATAVPIVVVSSREDERGKVAALDLGADAAPSAAAGRRATGVRQRRPVGGHGPAHRDGRRGGRAFVAA